MPEAVIVATARSPIGRAHKGSVRINSPSSDKTPGVNGSNKCGALKLTAP